ncbi:hypothetical protein ABK040_012259 [Willaertia magna]
MIANSERLFSFKETWLEQNDRPVLTVNVNLMAFFERIRGKLVITNNNIYFQPMCLFAAEPPVIRISRSVVHFMVKKKHLGKDLSLEVFFFGETSLLLICDNQTDRDNLYNRLSSSQLYTAEQVLEKEQKKWVNGVMSNYDYILLLNQLSGRSFNDISMYPIFPWVISDYKSQSLNFEDEKIFRDLSKPIGAYNEERLKKFRETNSQDSLYTSCLMSPSIVAYFLSRQYPEIMLHLTGGKFQPNILNNVYESWIQSISDVNDVKEVVPQFYNGEGEFLTNGKSLSVAQSSVVLPPWASSPSDFVQKCKQALESEFISNNLHHWIDLVFGIKVKSEKFNNVYPSICYSGVDILTGMSYYASRKRVFEMGTVPAAILKESQPTKISKLKQYHKQIENELETLKQNLLAQQTENEKLKQTIDEAKSKLLESENSALENVKIKEENIKIMEESIKNKDEKILSLEEELRNKEAEKQNLEEKINEVNLKHEKLSKELKELKKSKPQPSTTTVTNNRPEDGKLMNKYVTQLEKDLAQSKKDEQSRVAELEQTHQVLLKYMNKYKDAKERAERNWKKICEMKKLSQEINELQIIVQHYEKENRVKEGLICQLKETNKQQEEELRTSRSELRKLGYHVRNIEKAFEMGGRPVIDPYVKPLDIKAVTDTFQILMKETPSDEPLSPSLQEKHESGKQKEESINLTTEAIIAGFVIIVWFLMKKAKQLKLDKNKSNLSTKSFLNIVVTGGSRGIGFALVKHFLLNNSKHNVVFCSTTFEGIKKAINNLSKELNVDVEKEWLNKRLFAVECDITKYEQITDKLIPFVKDRLNNHVDLWINNAGTSCATNLLENLPKEDIDRVINTNLTGTIYCVEEAIKLIKNQQGDGGHIYIMEGLGSDGRNSPELSIYGVTKAGYRQFASTIAEETKDTKVGIHTVSPGMVITSLLVKPESIKKPRVRKIFNILAEDRDVVGKYLTSKLCKTRGSNGRIAFLTPLGVIIRFLTFFKRKNRFFNEDGTLKEYYAKHLD